jgi:hypothetical protein
VRAAAPLLFLAAAGCAAATGLADPPLAQLARWRTAGQNAIAAEPVVAPCPAGHPACPRLHALRVGACLGRALAARAPGAACPASRAAPLLDCAAESYAAALAATASESAAVPALRAANAAASADLDALSTDGEGRVRVRADATDAPARVGRSADGPALRAGLAQALLCRAELDTPDPAARHAAAAAAEAAAGAPPGLAALHRARAVLLLARVGPAPGRCAAARRALDLAASAPAEHRARLRADAALLHPRTCEPPR